MSELERYRNGSPARRARKELAAIKAHEEVAAFQARVINANGARLTQEAMGYVNALTTFSRATADDPQTKAYHNLLITGCVMDMAGVNSRYMNELR